MSDANTKALRSHAGRTRLGTILGSSAPSGRYRHYKGGLYEVLGFGRHSETQEDLVIYRQLRGDTDTLWVRPAHMFFEQVKLAGESVQRFTYLPKGQ